MGVSIVGLVAEADITTHTRKAALVNGYTEATCWEGL
jgi:hypothetical protein